MIEGPGIIGVYEVRVEGRERVKSVLAKIYGVVVALKVEVTVAIDVE